MEVGFKGRLERGKSGEVRISNRIATATENWLEYETGQRHAEISMRALALMKDARGWRRQE